MMKPIILSNMLDDNTLPEAGDALYSIMHQKISEGETLSLDMTGVISLPTMFLNMSIGKYISDFGVESLKGNLSFKNISKVQAEKIKKYIDDYSRLVS